MLKKRGDIINHFAKNNIILRDEKFSDGPKKSEESISGKLEQKSDQSIPKWVQVLKDRFDFIKPKINTNKDLATMIDNKRYTLNDTNELVNKIAEKKIGKINAIKAYNNLVNKAEQIAELRSTPHRQKMLKIFNCLGEIFNGPTGEESTSPWEGLKILTPNQMLSRLPISLAQLKAGNNSEKLKNKIRQLLYSLYRSKYVKNNSIKVWLTLFKNGKFIIKKHETLNKNLPTQVYPNKIKSRIVFKINTGYKLELLTPETIRLLESTKKDADADKNSENAPKLESVKIVLVHCNLVKNDY